MGVITKNSEGDGDHCAADMADDSHAVFALGAFTFIECVNYRAFEGRNCRSERNHFRERSGQAGR